MATHRAPPAGKHSRRISGESLLPLLYQFIRGCWIAVIAACLLASALGMAHAAGLPSAPSLVPQEIHAQIRSAIEDATGTIWAAPFSNGELYRWERTRWITVAGPGGKWMPLGFWHDPDGGIVIAWNAYRILPSAHPSTSEIALSAPPFAQSTLLTWRRGNEFRRIAQLNASVTSIIPTTKGQLLILGDGPQILLAQAGEKPRPVYTLRIEQFFLNPHPLSSFPRPFFRSVQLSGAQDAQGRTWLWCDAPAAGFNPSVLQGFLIYDGKSFVYHRTIKGLPDGRFSYVGRWDASHLIAAVAGDGLYLIDTAQFSAERMNDPEPYAFHVVQKVFHAGTDAYAISSAGRGRFSSSPFHDAVTTLWRFRNNHWQKVLAGVDTVSAFGPNARPWAHTRDGLWLGSIMHGLWFVPANGSKARMINWRQGFPFDSPAFLFALPKNRFLAINAFTHGSTLVLSPASLLSAPPPRRNVQLLRTHFLLQPDAKNRIWGFVDNLAPGLDEWDGTRWVTHPLPPNLELAWFGSLDSDAPGRIWLFPGCRSGPAAFFDPSQERWREFASYRRALEEQHGRPLQFQNPSQDPGLPSFGPGGRIAYMGPCGSVNYFDGSTWRTFCRAEIVNVMGMNDGPPFFDKSGVLKVDIAGETWKFPAGLNEGVPAPGGGWRKSPFDAGPVQHEVWFRPRPPGLIPAGCQLSQNDSLSRDRFGAYWWTWQGSLYYGRTGAPCRLVLSSSDAQPFIDGRRLRRVIVDAKGNVFFETTVTQEGHGEYVLVRARDLSR